MSDEEKPRSEAEARVTYPADRVKIRKVAWHDPALLTYDGRPRPEALQRAIEAECFDRAADDFFRVTR